MEKYIKPEMEIVEMSCEEVIATSNTGYGKVEDDITASGKSRNDFFDFDEPSSDEGFNLF